MRPTTWRPAVELSETERTIVKQIRRAKLFVWLREHRHELFDERFQAELSAAYPEGSMGQPPVAPALLALLALATILQGHGSHHLVNSFDLRYYSVRRCLIDSGYRQESEYQDGSKEVKGASHPRG